MEKVHIDDLERYMGAASEWRPVDGALGAENLSLGYYELEPDDEFLFGGIYRYEKREEVFYVQQGSITFETEDRTVEAVSGDVVRFAPDEWKGGTNTGTERAVMLQLGAPQERGERTYLRECPDCGERTPQDFELTEARDYFISYCGECGTELVRYTEEATID